MNWGSVHNANVTPRTGADLSKLLTQEKFVDSVAKVIAMGVQSDQDVETNITALTPEQVNSTIVLLRPLAEAKIDSSGQNSQLAATSEVIGEVEIRQITGKGGMPVLEITSDRFLKFEPSLGRADANQVRTQLGVTPPPGAKSALMAVATKQPVQVSGFKLNDVQAGWRRTLVLLEKKQQN